MKKKKKIKKIKKEMKKKEKKIANSKTEMSVGFFMKTKIRY